MCCIWDVAIGTPSLLPIYVPIEHCEKIGIWLGPPTAFLGNVCTYDVTVQLFPILIPYNNLGKENLKSNIIHSNLFYNRIKSFTFINTCSDHPYTYTYTTDSS